jgi:uncharacterized protein (TIGR02996 family)
MADPAAFLSAIVARPADDLPRLLYADWLDERGDPRGEFIRLQIADDPPSRARADTLLRRFGRLWAGPLADWSYCVNFSRGFPDQVVMAAEDFVQFADEVVRVAPVQRLTLINVRKWVPQLVRLPALRHLTALHLTGGQIEDEGVERLARCSFLANLRVLRLGSNRLTSGGVAALAASAHLGQLTRLDLPANDIGDWGARALAGSATLAGLEHLDVRDNGLSPSAVALLRTAPGLPRLVEVLATGQRAAEEHCRSSLLQPV